MFKSGILRESYNLARTRAREENDSNAATLGGTVRRVGTVALIAGVTGGIAASFAIHAVLQRQQSAVDAHNADIDNNIVLKVSEDGWTYEGLPDGEESSAQQIQSLNIGRQAFDYVAKSLADAQIDEQGRTIIPVTRDSAAYVAEVVEDLKKPDVNISQDMRVFSLMAAIMFAIVPLGIAVRNPASIAAPTYLPQVIKRRSEAASGPGMEM